MTTGTNNRPYPVWREDTTGTNNRLFRSVEWEGRLVFLESCEESHRIGCDHKGWVNQMHHYGPDGKDYGPTGILQCDCCGAIGQEPA